MVKQCNEDREKEVILRFKQLESQIIKQIPQELVTKLLSRLIKNEKWNCMILISMILLMVKHYSAVELKPGETNYKDQALGKIEVGVSTI